MLRYILFGLLGLAVFLAALLLGAALGVLFTGIVIGILGILFVAALAWLSRKAFAPKGGEDSGGEAG
ncbi:hypothetical protein [Euryhalocaulis caribicus]|uniref:hypothetical protein n=1 Tax=Euryhalocaulis caribicus TaxID=1161401 RepID=UPI0003A2D700|nr:hypothetical protein [Euryhalocaulis caribicus]